MKKVSPARKKKVRPRGQPTKYNDKLADKICEMISTSEMGLHSIATKLKLSPAVVYLWLNIHNYFLYNYTRARECQAELLADQIIAIADKSRIGKKTVKRGRITETTTGDMVERSKIQIDARKWKASKLAPKRFGDKLDVTSGGEKISPAPIYVIDNETQDALKNIRTIKR